VRTRRHIGTSWPGRGTARGSVAGAR
jgi:hypothetical protein